MNTYSGELLASFEQIYFRPEASSPETMIPFDEHGIVRKALIENVPVWGGGRWIHLLACTLRGTIQNHDRIALDDLFEITVEDPPFAWTIRLPEGTVARRNL